MENSIQPLSGFEKILWLAKGVQETIYSLFYKADGQGTGDSRYIIPEGYNLEKELSACEETKFTSFNEEKRKQYDNQIMSFHSNEKTLKKILIELGFEKLVIVLNKNFADKVINSLEKDGFKTSAKEINPFKIQNLKNLFFVISSAIILLAMMIFLSKISLYLSGLVGLILLSGIIILSLNPRFAFHNNNLQKWFRLWLRYDMKFHYARITLTSGLRKCRINCIIYNDAVTFLPETIKAKSCADITKKIEEAIISQLSSVENFI